MIPLIAGIATALWLGILTSISPCPLATNIAAITYIGRRVEETRLVLLTGLLYTMGRMVVYLVLGILIAGLLLDRTVSAYLEYYMHLALGPLMILIGMFLAGLLGSGAGVGAGVGDRMQQRVDRSGIWGGLMLGILFALAFCPTSAALFGMLLTLAVERKSPVLLPLLYGIGTALPVVVFAVVIAVSAKAVGRLFNALKNFEYWARLATGTLFILLGIYFCLLYIYIVF